MIQDRCMAGHNGRGYWKNMAPGVSIRDIWIWSKEMGKLSGSVVKWEAEDLQSELVPQKWQLEEFQSTFPKRILLFWFSEVAMLAFKMVQIGNLKQQNL